MNENTPMTPAQQLFAEEHHNLVYAFLNEKKLPEDEYYDVVVFGYLQAVMDYTAQGESSRFSFATIAWRKMESRLADHFRHQASYQACSADGQPQCCYGRCRHVSVRYALRNG